MSFPTAGSSVYYNEDGEVLGWDAPSYGEDVAEDWDNPEDPGDWYDDEPDADPATCEHSDRNMRDRRTGRPSLEEMPTREAMYWECMACGTELSLTADDWEWFFNPAF